MIKTQRTLVILVALAAGTLTAGCGPPRQNGGSGPPSVNEPVDEVPEEIVEDDVDTCEQHAEEMPNGQDDEDEEPIAVDTATLQFLKGLRTSWVDDDTTRSNETPTAKDQ